MKKILFIITGLETGGAEKVLVSLLGKLNREKFKPKLIILGEIGPLIERLDCEWEQINFKGNTTLGNFLKFVSAVLAFRPNLIQGWMYHGSLFAIIAKFLWPFSLCMLGIRNEKVDEGTLSKSTLKVLKLLTKFHNFSDLIIYPSEESKEVHRREGICKTETQIIPNGCDTDTYKPVAQQYKIDLRKKWNISDDAKVLAYVSRFHPHKDPVTFFRAVSILVKNIPNLKVVCAGQGFDCENQELVSLLRELSLEKNVILVSVVEKVHEIYQLSDGLVLSSIGEAFPNVIIEGMSCGLRCVSTDVGNVSKIFGPFSGIVEVKNEGLLANEIAMIIFNENKEVDLERREWIKKNYSVSKMVSNYENLWLKA